MKDRQKTNIGNSNDHPENGNLLSHPRRKRFPEKRKGGSLVFAARVFLGAVFLYASFDKILHPAAFADVIVNYQILPDMLTNLAAVILPWLEFFIGLALVFGIWMPGAVCLSNLLLIVFIGALAFNLARGLNIHCGCFESTIEQGTKTSMVWYVCRDSLFLIPSFYLLYYIRFKAGRFCKEETARF